MPFDKPVKLKVAGKMKNRKVTFFQKKTGCKASRFYQLFYLAPGGHFSFRYAVYSFDKC